MTQNQRPTPVPPLSYPIHNSSRPQTYFNNDIFLPRKTENELQREQQRKEAIAMLVEHTYGPNPKITQAQYDHMASLVDAQERQLQNDRSRTAYEEARPEWLKQNTTESTAHRTASALPPPPPPPPTSLPPSLHPSITHDDPRSFGIHRSSSPRMYGGTFHFVARRSPRNLHTRPPTPAPSKPSPRQCSDFDSDAVQNLSTPLPPPPPSFAGRPMLPPSPQFNAQSRLARDPPLPPSYRASGRDLPAPPPSTKSSSMSISSMLDVDPTKTHEHSGISATNGTSPNYTLSSSAPQPSAGSPTKVQYGNGSRHRGSPEAQSMPGSINRFRAYSGGTPQNTISSVKSGSPLSSHFGRGPSPRSVHAAAQDWRGRHDRHSDPGRLLERPSSQPSGPHTSIEDVNRRNLEMTTRQSNVDRSQSLRDDFASGQDRSLSSLIDPFRPQSHVNGSVGSEQTQQLTSHHSAPSDRLHTSRYPFLSSNSVFSEPAKNDPHSEHNSSGVLERKEFNAQRSPWGAEALRRIRDERLGATTVQPQRPPASESRPRFLDVLDDRRQPPDETKYAPAVLMMERSESLDGAIQQIRAGEDSHRNSLTLMLENNRRAGRASPLPQAVQGAQGQTNGPSRDPSIKNEFSKMFAGIGSGVSSSGLAGSGTSTPFAPPSPKQSESEPRLPFANRNDLIEITKSRNGSSNGSRMGNKRNRKAKDDNMKEMDGSKRVDTSKGAKRVRHHHHAPGYHHHHHYRIDEQTGTPIRVIGDPTATNHHHHHHPDGTIHYHTHSKTTPAAAQSKLLPPPRIPKTTIDNNTLLASISHLPRRHLGSVLYVPTLEPATSPSSLSSKFPYTNGQYVIPSCTRNDNCTLTVRIPRFYLTSSEREALCQRRAVWGSEVYTDDSNPLAAAIHAGWIRGEWGSGIDISMLEIEPGPENATDPKQVSFTSPPPSTLLPPKDRDLHLTLLILPPLKTYASTVAHGIKSRLWGRDHDGMSFKIEKMEWVNEGVAAGEERSGKAKKARMRALMRPSAGYNMPAVKVGLGKKRIAEVQAAA
ncbi:MAG: hypothetical protein Q9164_003403 [Protoblastenia rupestris]